MTFRHPKGIRQSQGIFLRTTYFCVSGNWDISGDSFMVLYFWFPEKSLSDLHCHGILGVV